MILTGLPGVIVSRAQRSAWRGKGWRGVLRGCANPGVGAAFPVGPLQGLGAARGYPGGSLAAECLSEGLRPAWARADLDGCGRVSGTYNDAQLPTSCGVFSRLGFQSLSGFLLDWFLKLGCFPEAVARARGVGDHGRSLRARVTACMPLQWPLFLGRVTPFSKSTVEMVDRWPLLG